MITESLLYIEHVLLPMGPWGVFLASILEEIIAPIPSAIVMLGSGFLFLDGELSFGLLIRLMTHVAIPVALGVVLGSLVIYGIVRWVGPSLLIRFGYIFGVTEEGVARAQAYFLESKRDDMAVCIARIIPVVPAVFIAIGAGLIQMPVGRYLALSFVGTIIRASILGIVGWQAGAVYAQYANVVDRWEKWVVMITALGILIFLFRRYQSHSVKRAQ